MNLQRLSVTLGNVPTITYILSYVVMIVVFATIYHFLPSNSFYHSTSRFEYSNLNLAEIRLLKKIEVNIKLNLKRTEVSFPGDSERYIFDPDQITFFGIRRKETLQNMVLTVFITFNNVDPTSEPRKRMIGVDFEIDAKKRIVINDNGIAMTPIQAVYSKANMDEEEVIEKLFFPDNLLRVPMPLYDELSSLDFAYDGFPDKINGHWLRMLYLSFGVSTSNVFGDIVPLNSLARGLVSLQGLIGLLIIGLFLNSIGYDISKILDEKRSSHITNSNEEVQNEKLDPEEQEA